MTVHSLVETLAGTGAVLLMMGGLWLIAGPRTLWRRWFELEHGWRAARFHGGWTHLELAMGRRGYFWVPRHVEVRSPRDIYAYALSDDFWSSKFSWLVRLLCWYSGGLLLVAGLAILGFGP